MNYRSQLRALLTVRCRHLCTKAAVQPLPDPDEVESVHDTAIFWCARTTESLGPDGSSAEPGDCDAPGRTCYETRDV
jgi:hypothetical protein